MIDIDHFKHVNDRHGHAAGDAVIVEVSRRIAQAVRSEDLVVRWGGEEFLVFARNVAPDQLQLLAERILFSVGQEPVPTAGGALAVTCSIGFAHFPLPPAQLALHWEQAVNWADMVLYKAKAEGRNRAVGIADVQAPSPEALAALLQDLDGACQGGQCPVGGCRDCESGACHKRHVGRYGGLNKHHLSPEEEAALGGSDYGATTPAGPPTGAVAYPYYTTRGPRDFLAKCPPSIGP